MYKILAGLVAVLLILVGLTFVAGRGGHETYDAKAFSPGPAIGILKALSDDALEGRLPGTEGNERAREIIINRMKALELLTVGGREYEHAFTFGNFAEPDAPKQTGINIISVRQGKSSPRPGSGHLGRHRRTRAGRQARQDQSREPADSRTRTRGPRKRPQAQAHRKLKRREDQGNFSTSEKRRR